MSLLETSPYRFEVNSSFYYKGEFLQFLKKYFKEIVNYKLSVYEQMDVDIYNRVYSFFIEEIPTEVNNEFSISQEIIEEELSSSEETLIEELELLNPLEPEPLKIELTLSQIIDEVIKQLQFFEISLIGSTKSYFGIIPNSWFTGHPLLLEEVMKRVDYGDLEYEPLNLFVFIFYSFQMNISLLYDTFLKRGADYVNNSEL